jgi:pimeloyl-ACP methyl ester carboxylesterase
MLPGTGFQHAAYARVTDGDALLVLFIEGDGLPWVHGGRAIASDPTSSALLALALAAQTPGSVLYLGRPCYLAARSDPACATRWWTFDRYAPEVVTSLAAAATRFMEAHHLGRTLLVGHSGGGTLAVLLAERLPRVAGVISIAGNLDPDEWTRQHRYTPLTGANPALEPALPRALPQWYLVGGRDMNVSEAMAARYLDRVSPDRIWRYALFDHHCCWQRAWPEVYARVTSQLSTQDADILPAGNHPSGLRP